MESCNCMIFLLIIFYKYSLILICILVEGALGKHFLLEGLGGPGGSKTLATLLALFRLVT